MVLLFKLLWVNLHYNILRLHRSVLGLGLPFLRQSTIHFDGLEVSLLENLLHGFLEILLVNFLLLLLFNIRGLCSLVVFNKCFCVTCFIFALENFWSYVLDPLRVLLWPKVDHNFGLPVLPFLLFEVNFHSILCVLAFYQLIILVEAQKSGSVWSASTYSI